MAIISYTTFKTLLGITSTSEDAKLTLLCDYVDRAIKKYIGYDLENVTYPATQSANSVGDSGYYSGNGTNELLLRHRPVWNDNNLTVSLDASGYFGDNPNGAFASTTLLVEGTDYSLRVDGRDGSTNVSTCGLLVRLNGNWPAMNIYRSGSLVPDQQLQRGNIYVTYKAGYSTVPVDIVAAAAYWVAHLRRTMPQGGNIQSENLGAYSYSMAAVTGGAIPADVKAMLAPYRNIVI